MLNVTVDFIGQFYLFILHVSRHVARNNFLWLEIFDEVLQFGEAAVTRITNPVVTSTFTLDGRFVRSLWQTILDQFN
jgi:hypothetical protein